MSPEPGITWDALTLLGAAALSVAVAWAAFLLARRFLMRLGNVLALGATLTVLVGVVNVVALSLTDRLDNVGVVLGALTLSGAVAGGFALLAAHDLRKDLLLLEAAAERIAGGDLASRVPLRGVSDISRMGDAFNRMADALARAERDKAGLERTRQELIAGVSHDLRTPVAALRSIAEALTAGVVQDPEEIERYLHTMEAHIRALSALIDDMFELARLQEGALVLAVQPVDVVEVIRETVDAVEPEAERRGLRLSCRSAGVTEPIPIDPQRIQRVMLNLLRNALEYTPSGGTVEVTAEATADAIRVAVEDSGSGIAADDLPRVFGRLFTGDRSRGTGLGLAISKGIVEAHGGAIEADSRPGEGTRISFRLPRGGPPEAGRPPP